MVTYTATKLQCGLPQKKTAIELPEIPKLQYFKINVQGKTRIHELAASFDELCRHLRVNLPYYCHVSEVCLWQPAASFQLSGDTNTHHFFLVHDCLTAFKHTEQKQKTIMKDLCVMGVKIDLLHFQILGDPKSYVQAEQLCRGFVSRHSKNCKKWQLSNGGKAWQRCCSWWMSLSQQK